jgi:hypothetical protein
VGRLEARNAEYGFANTELIGVLHHFTGALSKGFDHIGRAMPKLQASQKRLEDMDNEALGEA